VRRFNDAFRVTYGRPPSSFRKTSARKATRHEQDRYDAREARNRSASRSLRSI
jgi:hypothetical protein